MRRSLSALSVAIMFGLAAARGLAAEPGGVGELTFANSGASAAQAPFLRGLALLHDFEYADAADAFRAAEALDPSFTMAFWGEAMTDNHPVWMEQDAAAARAALARLAPTPPARLATAKTERERMYLAAVESLYGTGSKEERDIRYADAMAALHARFPDDVDATAFYALALLGTNHAGRDFATYMRAAALLEDVYPTHERHPGVLHYLIHAYDDPIHAPLGLRAATRYAAVAPDAAHAIHMTSHIFIALGRWDDVVSANEQAMRVVNRHRAERGRPAAVCGHYVSWLDYAYLQERRVADAQQQLDACRRAALNAPVPGSPPAPQAAIAMSAWAEMSLVHFIETGRHEATAVPANATAGPAFTLAYADALAAAATRRDPASLHAAAARVRDRQQAVAAEIKHGAIPEGDGANVDIEVQQIAALEALRDGRTSDGIALLQRAAAAENRMPMEFGPPVIEKPTFELLGDELVALNRFAEAETAYASALARAPGRTRSLEGRLRAEEGLGKREAAALTRAQLQRYVRPSPAVPR